MSLPTRTARERAIAYLTMRASGANIFLASGQVLRGNDSAWNLIRAVLTAAGETTGAVGVIDYGEAAALLREGWKPGDGVRLLKKGRRR